MSEKSLCDRRNVSPHCLANAIIVMRHLQNNAIYKCAERKYRWKAFFLQIDNYEYGLCLPLELISSWNCRLIWALNSLQGGFPCLGEMVNWSCSVLVSNGLWYDKEDEMRSRSTSLASQHTDHHHICIALVSNGQWYGKEREGNIVISGRTLNWPTLMNAKYIMYDI